MAIVIFSSARAASAADERSILVTLAASFRLLMVPAFSPVPLVTAPSVVVAESPVPVVTPPVSPK